MEAENYLSSGFGIRQAMDAKPDGLRRLAEVARTWQPSRLKGILVGPADGVPFLAATQVFDLRPAARKWLALERTPGAEERFVAHGTILVTCSGSVGRATVAHRPHDRILISHDLLRVQPRDERWWGWLFAYLRAPRARKMMTAKQYGHIIKHLETSHLDTLPVLNLREHVLDSFNAEARRMVELRDAAHDLVSEAEVAYEARFKLAPPKAPETGFVARVSGMSSGRRRLEAAVFHPRAITLERALAAQAHAMNELRDLTSGPVFVPGRFKHVYGDEGAPYLDSADILEVCPDITKYLLSLGEEERREYEVEPGWLLMPCSGQVYGNVGSVVIATEWHRGKVLSNHILRAVPAEGKVRVGYLQCALGHPVLGRPLVIRLAFGSSVPELDPVDVGSIRIPRLDSKLEGKIADMMELAAEKRGEADRIESAMATRADELILAFLEGDRAAIEHSGSGP